ncbi:MAG: hypothetical protein ACTHLJ_03280 [Angustibacter sp.]
MTERGAGRVPRRPTAKGALVGLVMALIVNAAFVVAPVALTAADLTEIQDTIVYFTLPSFVICVLIGAGVGALARAGRRGA